MPTRSKGDTGAVYLPKTREVVVPWTRSWVGSRGGRAGLGGGVLGVDVLGEGTGERNGGGDYVEFRVAIAFAGCGLTTERAARVRVCK